MTDRTNSAVADQFGDKLLPKCSLKMQNVGSNPDGFGLGKLETRVWGMQAKPGFGFLGMGFAFSTLGTC